jgi:CDP-diacylglycerol--glycerol-3-phosphate 3-phosphatidyltransferase
MNLKFDKIYTLSNLISFIRIFLVIPFILLVPNLDQGNNRLWVLLLITVGFISDVMDGYIARRLNEVTELGKIIDPLADKICIVAIITTLYLSGEISTFYFAVIVLRDVIIFFGGIAVSKKIGKVLPSNLLGKITVVSIGFVIVSIVIDLKTHSIFMFDFLYYSSILLSFASVAGYALRAYEIINWNKKSETS